MKRKVTVSRILRNPAFIFLSIGLGIYIGIKFPDFTKNIKSFGEFYLRFLKFLVLPLLATVLITGISNLVRLSRIKGLLKKVLLGFFVTILFSAGIGIAVGVVGKPGLNLTEKQSSAIIDFIDLESRYNIDDFSISSTLGFITNLGDYTLLSIILFSILLGLAIAHIRKENSDNLIEFSESLLLVFQKIIEWMMIILPLALISILANQASSSNFEMILVMLRFITIFSIVLLIVFIFGTLIIWVRSGQKFGTVVVTLLEPILISLSTGRSITALPSAITTMSKKLKFHRESIQFSLPFGQNFGQYGNIVYFAISTVFVSQLYSYHLGVNAILLIVLGSILAGLSSVGTSGFTTLSLFVISLSFLKLPAEGVVLLFATIESVMQPMRSLLTVIINLITTSLIAQPDSYFENDETPGVLFQNIPEDTDLRTYFQNYDGEIPIIELSKSDFLASVFPKANFKIYKNWKLVEPLWSSFDYNIVVGDKDYIKELSHQESGEIKFAVLNRK